MRATNLALDLIDVLGVGAALPNETELASRFGVSRTAIRSALMHLSGEGVVRRQNGGLVVGREPHPLDYYETTQIESRLDLVERRFTEIAVNGELQPGKPFAEAELARLIGVSTVSIREFLIGFSRYGLVEKAARGGWRLCVFDEAFGRELAATRRTFELQAIRHFSTASPDDPAWRQIDAFLRDHQVMLSATEPMLRRFTHLDRAFHRFLVGRLKNRFVDSFYDVVSFVFHYHYQWQKHDQAERYRLAIREHLAVLDALTRQDIAAAERCLDLHLATSLTTLLASAVRTPLRHEGGG